MLGLCEGRSKVRSTSVVVFAYSHFASTVPLGIGLWVTTFPKKTETEPVLCDFKIPDTSNTTVRPGS